MLAVEINSILGIIFAILTVFVKVYNTFDDMQLENQDITSDLSDNELKLALSDLSLKDLDTLQKFIDSTDYEDLDHQDQRFINTNAKTLDGNNFEAQDFDNIMYYNPEQEDYNFEPLNNKNDLNYYIKPKEENQRAKRADEKVSLAYLSCKVC
ncbi:uncharacterized protein LOC119609155 isoform X2 [Lucilia sericata]|uniref:uncharacterized protein LOC119609155 isoform X2 n=1 Tax=Lucilia sericata TaxID=13632 RepID=UPI0018A82DFC|nr:uncharacterized protein LOC119609155 isoform X2 [Lucilia sericata]